MTELLPVWVFEVTAVAVGLPLKGRILRHVANSESRLESRISFCRISIQSTIVPVIVIYIVPVGTIMYAGIGCTLVSLVFFHTFDIISYLLSVVSYLQ